MNKLSSPSVITDPGLEVRFIGAAYHLGIAVAGWMLLAFAFSLLSRSSFSEAIWASQLTFCLLIALHFLMTLLKSISLRGKVELDCGPFPNWRQTASCTALHFLFIAIWMTFGTPPTHLILMCACFWPIALGLSLGRLQVCTNGLFVYTFLLPWKTIRSYQWMEDGSLLIERRSRFYLPRLAIAVPLENRGPTEQALNASCGQIKTANHPSTPLATDPC